MAAGHRVEPAKLAVVRPHSQLRPILVVSFNRAVRFAAKLKVRQLVINQGRLLLAGPLVPAVGVQVHHRVSHSRRAVLGRYDLDGPGRSATTHLDRRADKIAVLVPLAVGHQDFHRDLGADQLGVVLFHF